jgi:hypothetical protein
LPSGISAARIPELGGRRPARSLYDFDACERSPGPPGASVGKKQSHPNANFLTALLKHAELLVFLPVEPRRRDLESVGQGDHGVQAEVDSTGRRGALLWNGQRDLNIDVPAPPGPLASVENSQDLGLRFSAIGRESHR